MTGAFSGSACGCYGQLDAPSITHTAVLPAPVGYCRLPTAMLVTDGEQAVFAMRRVVPVAAIVLVAVIVPVFPAGRYRRRRGITTVVRKLVAQDMSRQKSREGCRLQHQHSRS